MTIRQAAFLSLCFPTPNERSDYILKDYGVDRFLTALKEQDLPLFLSASDKKHIRAAGAEKADALLALAKKDGEGVLCFSDPAYPEALRQMPGSPILLYYKGDLRLLERLCICVVGSRRVSDYGMTVAANLACALAKVGVAVVSGFARGCDAAAHAGALLAKGKTVAVCGCGLDIPYPEGNEKLRTSIEKTGLFLSEYPPGTPAAGGHFPVRNRILAGLSKGVLLAEAAEQSGALITANLAAELGKDVFVVPNSIFDANARGTILLMKQGAKPVSCAADLLEEYSNTPEYALLDLTQLTERPCVSFAQVAHLRDKMALTPPKSHSVPTRARKKNGKGNLREDAKPVQKRPDPQSLGLSDAALRCCGLLSESPISLPELSVALELPIPALMTAITELELCNLIEALPGRRYCRPRDSES